MSSTAVKSNPGCFVAVGSDSRLVVRNGLFSYDPKYAWSKRMARTRAAGILKYIPEARIVIGDPFRKPSDGFWRECMNLSGAARAGCVMVDDSLRVVSDAKRFGFKGILLDRAAYYAGRSTEGADLVVASFDEIPTI